MTDYYEVLGVKPSSSQKEIKKAFRDKAKLVHPDVAGRGSRARGGPTADAAARDGHPDVAGRSSRVRGEPTADVAARDGHPDVAGASDTNEAAEAQMRLLLEAYETLFEPERRQEYDKRHKAVFERFSFDYRSYLKSRPDDGPSQAKLVFYDLLHGWEDEALETWERVSGSGEGGGGEEFLEAWIDREDAMDCAFLLAEEYEKRGSWLRAFGLYRQCIVMEKKKSYFRHFFPEVVLRIKELVRVKLSQNLGPEELLDCLDRMIDLGFPRKETARFLRQKAEIQLRMGKREGARDDLVKALELDRKLSGVQHLRDWTGIDQ